MDEASNGLLDLPFRPASRNICEAMCFLMKAEQGVEPRR